MIFLVKDQKNSKRDESLARHVINVHINRKVHVVEGEISTEKLKKYISYCKGKCQPRLSIEASNLLENYYVEQRANVQNNNNNKNNGKQVIPITVRQLEALIRISESLAKMNLSKLASEGIILFLLFLILLII
jgi:DNA replication licensing factor MCM5